MLPIELPGAHELIIERTSVFPPKQVAGYYENNQIIYIFHVQIIFMRGRWMGVNIARVCWNLKAAYFLINSLQNL